MTYRAEYTDGLYTKITGGQRVDLFGAEKADLPSIWKELVDAGFESGHAYGERFHAKNVTYLLRSNYELE